MILYLSFLEFSIFTSQIDMPYLDWTGLHLLHLLKSSYEFRGDTFSGENVRWDNLFLPCHRRKSSGRERGPSMDASLERTHPGPVIGQASKAAQWIENDVSKRCAGQAATGTSAEWWRYAIFCSVGRQFWWWLGGLVALLSIGRENCHFRSRAGWSLSPVRTGGFLYFGLYEYTEVDQTLIENKQLKPSQW